MPEAGGAAAAVGCAAARVAEGFAPHAGAGFFGEATEGPAEGAATDGAATEGAVGSGAAAGMEVAGGGAGAVPSSSHTWRSLMSEPRKMM